MMPILNSLAGTPDILAHIVHREYRGRGGASPYEPRIFTNHELAALFSAADRIAGEDVACHRAQAALVLRLLYSTGMRCGEACSLEKGDVDLDAGVLHVRNAKNGRERVVPMHPSVAERIALGYRQAMAALKRLVASTKRAGMEGTAPVDTREAISREFMRAYARKRLDRITVKGLCAAVPVARTTFYARYRNVDDVLAEVEDRLLAGLANHDPDVQPHVIEL